MKIDVFFDNADDITADKIAESYPILNEDHKERLFAMSKRKYDTLNTTSGIKEDKVRGVEKYRRPKWYKAFSIAAAAVLTFGGIGGCIALISKNGKVPAVSSEISTETETAEAATEATTEAIMSEADCIGITKELTQNYYEIANILMGANISVDMNDSISFYLYNSEYNEWDSPECRFYRVTDERFKNIEDIYNCYKQYVVSEKCPDNYLDAFTLDGCGIGSYLGGDVSKFRSGDSIDTAAEDDITSHYFFCPYVEYDGALYAVSSGEKEVQQFITDPEITDISADGFTASMYYIPEYDAENTTYGCEMIFKIIREDDTWKLESIDYGTYAEGEANSLIVCYLEDKEEYYDLDIDNGISLKVSEYDKESKKCRIDGIIKDLNGNDAIEINAHADLGNFEIIDIDITRLREHDENLKRASALWREELYKVSRAVKKYVEENEEYSGMGLDTDYKNIYAKIYEYDESTGICTAHTFVRDSSGEPALDWLVSVDMNTETVLSAEEHSY